MPRQALHLFTALALGGAPGADLAHAQEPEAEWRDQRAVNAAIDRGVEWLLQHQNRDGSWGPTPLRDEAHFDQRNGQTALALYTLLRSQVPRAHPAVRRAETYLLQGSPRTTYAVSCQLMALGALADPAHEERIEELVDQLVSYQRDDTQVWGYPTHGSVAFDLSNTQYAVLGLRAGEKAGVEVRDRVWQRAIEGVYAFQETPRASELPTAPGATASGPRELAGFCYDPWDAGARKGTRGHGVTGSMTAAGVAILRLCEDGLDGELKRRARTAFDASVARGLTWLEQHFAVDHNPGGSASWHYYYLYGLERVGALLGVERIGAHDWYWESARELVKLQEPDGSWKRPGASNWPPEPLSGGNTCFALLVLVRATAPSSGIGASDGIWALEGPEHQVGLRAAGRGTLAAWVSGFAPEVLAAHPAGLRVREVVWLVDGAVVARLPGDATQAWRDERFALRHRFERAGTHTVEARVAIDSSLSESDANELRSGVLSVEASDVLEDWMLRYAEESGASLWKAGRLTLSASSSRDKHGPDRAVDGLQFTCWLPRDDDAEPKLRFRFSKPIRAARLAFSQAGANEAARAGHGEVRRLELHFDGSREAHLVELDPDPRKKTYFELPRSSRRLREIEVRVLERAGEGASGFAEVELLGD